MQNSVSVTKDSAYLNPSLTIQDRVQNLLGQMTLAEKIGQMTQVEKNSITPTEVTEYFIGSVLSGGGGNPTPNSPRTWAEMVRSFQLPALQTRLAIPLIYGSDGVHGHSNVKGAVIFPHNIGLGATHDTDLAQRMGRIVADECKATGVHWDFAPAVSVPQDIRWGRTYEGYSEDTALVSKMGVAFLKGLQNMDEAGIGPIDVLASIKHFVADGGTRWAIKTSYPWLPTWTFDGNTWGIDQENADIDEATLRTVHLAPYRAAIQAGAMNIMVSYSSWQGVKMHAHRTLITDVLKTEMGFEGFVVSDWHAVDQLSPDYAVAVETAINAGLDMVMVPFQFKQFISTMIQAVDQGRISQDRIDDAVRRILLAKFRLGLFEHPLTDESLVMQVGSPAHRAVAREAVRKSLVLLKNENQALPLTKTPTKLLIAGHAADNIGLQCGGWTIEWMGQSGNITEGTTILDGIRQALDAQTDLLYSSDAEFGNDVQAETGILVIAEEPYAEGFGDRADLTLDPKYALLSRRLREHCAKVVCILLSGRPLIITDQLDHWDAFVAAWLPGTEGQGVADVLFGNYPFTGRLSYRWPRSMDQIGPAELSAHSSPAPLWPIGYGLCS